MSRGRFITLEGGEGAGKSTQVRLLAEALRAAGIDALATREPGGAPGAEQIRGLLVGGPIDRWDAMTEALLHCAARREHLVKTIEPALAAGKWVVSDRFADSTLAYQGYGLGLGAEAVTALTRITVGEFAPDLTIVLDLPPQEGLKRAHGRGEHPQRYERMKLEFHERLRHGFLEIAKREPRRCAVLDARMEASLVAESIHEIVRVRLGVELK
ncbi:MAG TPA: dTMP kinase [Alphaproteobacteria bacterium]|nr:dTMP kinase [Alphaproteobacteria bacterium]